MATECRLSRKLQVRKRGHTVSTVDKLDKTESRGQDTKPVSKEQQQPSEEHISRRQGAFHLQHRTHQKLTDTAGKTIRKKCCREVHKPTSSLICGAKAKLVRGLVIRVGSQPFLIKSRPIQLKSKTQMIKLSSEHL